MSLGIRAASKSDHRAPFAHIDAERADTARDTDDRCIGRHVTRRIAGTRGERRSQQNNGSESQPELCLSLGWQLHNAFNPAREMDSPYRLGVAAVAEHSPAERRRRRWPLAAWAVSGCPSRRGLRDCCSR